MARIGGHDFKVHLLVAYGRQLGRSLLLLAHYASVFVSLMVRSVSCAMLFVKWTVFFTHCVASAFDTLYKHMHWLGRRGGAVATEIYSGSDTESD